MIINTILLQSLQDSSELARGQYKPCHNILQDKLILTAKNTMEKYGVSAVYTGGNLRMRYWNTPTWLMQGPGREWEENWWKDGNLLEGAEKKRMENVREPL
ncbi:hypothetical protein O3G_MSEX007433 [Manduca sexta]|uniref:Uncharacterized protein n=1 Tax=Manduca sexta TaxID=7130 RepID=A0A922CMU9_MANSE|nr:hypothetical protein O3G_MSEX007433 [Manduca sexta]